MSMSSCLVSGTFVGEGLVHSIGFGGEFVCLFALSAGFPVGPVGVAVKEGPVVGWQQDSAMSVG